MLDAQCPRCPRSVDNPLLTKLIHYLAMSEGGRPNGPNDMSDNEWLLLGALIRKRADLTIQKEKEESESKGNG